MNIELVEKEDTIDEKLDEKLIEHHTKYKEIHGKDETIFMTLSEHQKLHIRLRKEGKCNIPSDKLNKISTRAHQRTEKYIEKYNKKLKGKFNRKNIEEKLFNTKDIKEIDKRVKERVLGIKS